MKLIPVLSVALVVAAAMPAVAQERVVPDTYLAVTTNMSPAGVELKADVLRWSTEDEREAAIAALQSEEPSAALRALPSMGVIWRSNSAVGNAIKYAHRSEAADGGERITLITDRKLGYSTFNPWRADAPATDESLDYSVMEMTVGETGGHGTLSLSAEVIVDTDSMLVSLDRGDSAWLLTDVRMAPKPYWAREPGD